MSPDLVHSLLQRRLEPLPGLQPQLPPLALQLRRQGEVGRGRVEPGQYVVKGQLDSMNPPEADAGQVPPPVGDSAGLRAEGGHPGEQGGVNEWR